MLAHRESYRASFRRVRSIRGIDRRGRSPLCSLLVYEIESDETRAMYISSAI